MKYSKRLVSLSLAAVALFTVPVYAEAPGVPGSANDPVVTKSYVDQKIAQVTGSSGKSLVVEQLSPGQVLYGYEGTEFIVRTGRVVAVSGINGDGLTDITAGADLSGGTLVGLNHLLLIARSDSRGLRLADDYNGIAYIMIRGKYSVE
ncbi:hypothetical protein [Brevibacillus dissolubilis]|uniref:hypothetical protein n=1 Tax=Brevibacillus dissolubilis TaxID=1844116 RepID=UPI0011179622|nr:hypothetical protein [Brevibacillus dissolubilis]